MEDNIDLTKFKPIEGFNNYFINDKAFVIEVKPVKIYKYPNRIPFIYINNRHKSLINIFAKTFIKNKYNVKNAELIDKNKDISINNVRWKLKKNEIYINIYLAKRFRNRHDIIECDKILLKSYDNLEDCCKFLNIGEDAFFDKVNKIIFKPKSLNTYIYTEAIYGK